MKKDSPKVKKTKFRKCLLPAALFVLVLLMLVLVLTAYRPKRYAPVKITDNNLISPYLTHHLLPAVYNGAQLGQPFEVVITQDGLNDIVARFPQPIKLHNITLTDPQVIFTPMQITLMATVKARPVNPVLTIEVSPFINQHGLLNLCINRVLLGNIDITSIAMSIGNKAYSNWLSSTGTEPDNIAAQVCRSLLNNEPFEPIFEIGGKQLRVSNIEIMTKKTIVLLTPAPD